ncbi:MAG: PorP/SprF family type IX secretion system membrane protein [Bacteroidetes bacterium]|nr:PorP/SprF family type IX secretion system membrane protein [Bacteroidota bacterium]
MKKIILLIAAFVCILQAAWSQEQAAVFSHYHISPILISPAVAGFYENHQIQMNIRSQWTGFTDAPQSYGIGYNGPIGKTLGIGVGVMSENLGNMTNTRFQLNYAFRYELKNVKFAAGFSTEFITKRLAGSVLDNPLLSTVPDETIMDAIDGNKIFDASLGFWGTFKKNTFIGITFPNLVVTKIGEIETGKSEGAFKYSILHVGHEFDIEPYNFKLRPSLMVRKLKDTPLQVDFNMLGSFINDKLIAGVSVRTGLGGATGILLGTNIDVFRLYYSYDLTFQKVQQYNGGTHEITIAFSFANGKKRFDRG